MTPTPKSWSRLIRRYRLWARRVHLNRKMAFSLAAAAGVAGLATFSMMTDAGPDLQTVLFMLYLDAVLLLLLGAVVARRLVGVWVERRKGAAGSRLHTRLVLLFSLVAVTPAILVAVFSAIFFNFGIETWFNDRVRTALEASNAAASAYLKEHKQNIRSDALAAANDLNKDALTLMRNPRIFGKVLTAQAGLRNLPEALVIDSRGNVLARSKFSQTLEFELVPPGVLERAAMEGAVVITSDKDDRVRAVVKLNRFVDAYLLVGRFVDPKVLNYIAKTKGAVAQYQRLERKQEGIQITFVVIFTVVTLLLLLAAVWIGLTLANQLARPLSNLIAAAERVRKGDLGVRVDASTSADEIGALCRGFNRMTSQIETQQEGLIEANRQLDERRRFTETVLTGVSAGVIGLDGEGRINLPNPSASELLDTDLEKAQGKELTAVIPEMSGLLGGVMGRPERMQQGEIHIHRKGGARTLLVRMAAEGLAGDVIGYVVTFDDITELLSAQRTAAWADVARRIAHEIKNPLTPIQLSAERLKRKYLKQITTDPDTFSICTDTIVRQVGDIGRMVDEFSSFARMPQPDLKSENLTDICRQAIFLERNRNPDIEFTGAFPEKAFSVRCDIRQIGQALTNLLKNAAESINDRISADGGNKAPGEIKCTIEETGKGEERRVSILVEDNGKGLPKELLDRIAEPYVTTRTGGTGLGLAIVKKIMEDHNGELVLEDLEAGGVRATMIFHPAATLDTSILQAGLRSNGS